jgi:O-acetylserine/cysteine efflux transporter
MSAALPFRHFLLALAVVAVWGSNFVVIKLGLAHLPPLLFAALRFLFALLPAVFFLRRPAVPWRELAAYGVLIGAGQFGLLYLAMKRDISPGLASLVVQTQVFFTIGMAMRLSHERLQRYQWAALALAVAGIAVIAAHTDANTTVLGLALVLLAAFSWASGNLVARRAGSANMLAYVVWASMFSVPPLLLLSLLFEGPQAIVEGLRAADLATWAAVLWQSVGNTLFGYAAWAWLLARHPAATVSPMALLVPVFGMGASAWWLGEPLPGWKLLAAALVMGGLAINLFWPRWRGLWAGRRVAS